MSHERALATIAQADALICFSHYETFGITCAEALCMGVPVIYTPCGGPEEYIQKHMGIEVPLQDESALTQAIIALSNGTITFDKNRILTDARALFDNAQWLKKLKCIY
jgi:glycosyltransferase involved in cell wall biosynthesis